MTPEVASQPREPYYWRPSPFARDYIHYVDPTNRDAISDAIEELTFTPHPPDQETWDDCLAIIVETTRPHHYLIYKVNDEMRQIDVMALQPKASRQRR